MAWPYVTLKDKGNCTKQLSFQSQFRICLHIVTIIKFAT